MSDQPCENFEAAEISPYTGAAMPHECPKCLGIRRFCRNCCFDHHDGGWIKCDLLTSQKKPE